MTFVNRFRITEEKEYIKVVTSVSRVHGAVLIGDTDLEEVIENLILNQTDISQIEENLLDPSVNFDFFRKRRYVYLCICLGGS